MWSAVTIVASLSCHSKHQPQQWQAINTDGRHLYCTITHLGYDVKDWSMWSLTTTWSRRSVCGRYVHSRFNMCLICGGLTSWFVIRTLQKTDRRNCIYFAKGFSRKMKRFSNQITWGKDTLIKGQSILLPDGCYLSSQSDVWVKGQTSKSNEWVQILISWFMNSRRFKTMCNSKHLTCMWAGWIYELHYGI